MALNAISNVQKAPEGPSPLETIASLIKTGLSLADMTNKFKMSFGKAPGLSGPEAWAQDTSAMTGDIFRNYAQQRYQAAMKPPSLSDWRSKWPY